MPQRPMLLQTQPAFDPGFDCQTCGACCSFSADWPRFSLESDSQLDSIPRMHIAADESGMRCDGVRCSALAGEVGAATACTIYDVRPDVCRACVPGGDDCRMARRSFGMADFGERPAAAPAGLDV